MLQQESPRDYIIATGLTNSLRDFVDLAFSTVGLSANDYLESDQNLMRPSDLRYSAVDPSRIRSDLGWKASLRLPEIVSSMLNEYV
jgi:GDPmannose 4,6-dehydratase